MDRFREKLHAIGEMCDCCKCYKGKERKKANRQARARLKDEDIKNKVDEDGSKSTLF